VGQNKPVTGTGFTLAGADKDNYELTSVANTTASILFAPFGTACNSGPGHTILQPINADGSSIVKQGSTVPAKFRVCDAAGNSIGGANVVGSFLLVGVSSAPPGSVNEPVDSTTPDTAFRWGGDQWIFNISTKSLQSGRTYSYRITLIDGTFIDFRFTTK
jgi:hypothetical protein